MQIKNILCPVDFSPLAIQALARASKLAKRHQARLHVVHIYEPIFTDAFGEGIEPADIAPIHDQLEDLCPADPEVECCHELIYGLPAGSIVGYARTNQIDLIVMGTRGDSKRWSGTLGSVAENVVRWAPCAVLTVHSSTPSAKLGNASPGRRAATTS